MSYFFFLHKINIKNYVKTIFELGSRDLVDSIELLNYFEKSKVYAFECNHDCLVECNKNLLKLEEDKKEKIFCERRNFSQVDTKFQKEIIWIIWDLFLSQANKRSKFIKKIMDALLTLFTLKYVSGCQKKRRNIYFFLNYN